MIRKIKNVSSVVFTALIVCLTVLLTYFFFFDKPFVFVLRECGIEGNYPSDEVFREIIEVNSVYSINFDSENVNEIVVEDQGAVGYLYPRFLTTGMNIHRNVTNILSTGRVLKVYPATLTSLVGGARIRILVELELDGKRYFSFEPFLDERFVDLQTRGCENLIDD
ncbi:hypothetical protein OE749_16010 [Aestuariibacter sp. AA17]|uniref:Uncharacterized protein n=1 Tax=Fluctibacter corallii TaxID=2984329 RepID=A0ABT3AC40_9ALTE|nr:hypothetical protein [Aestuariibacter sp. AA17]MCV2886198.1 hypothetical protein [Aestuariibacter sp. AA17]